MTYLVDNNVLTEPTKAQPDGNAIGWLSAHALEHDLTVATRNVRDFKKAGVKVVDPFVVAT